MNKACVWNFRANIEQMIPRQLGSSLKNVPSIHQTTYKNKLWANHKYKYEIWKKSRCWISLQTLLRKDSHDIKILVHYESRSVSLTALKKYFHKNGKFVKAPVTCTRLFRCLQLYYTMDISNTFCMHGVLQFILLATF